MSVFPEWNGWFSLWHIELVGKIHGEYRCEGGLTYRNWSWMDLYDDGVKVACGIPQPSTATITYPSESFRRLYA